MSKKIPDKWSGNTETVKAIQVAFELDSEITRKIKERAARNDLTPSAQIRKILGLSYTPPKRPRLTASLMPEDYEILGKRYDVDPSNMLEIKRRIINELVDIHEEDGK